MIKRLFSAFLLCCVSMIFSQTDTNSLVGANRCQRCHAELFTRWQNNPKKQECESCHGPGKFHVLAPTPRNIQKPKQPGFSHGDTLAGRAPAPKEKLLIELFVMSYCPYGIAALNTLLPLVDRWKGDIDFRLYYIAHRRGDSAAAPVRAASPDLPTEKCEGTSSDLDGTDRFVSLHGLNEVLEDIRQTVIAEKFPKLLLPYLSARNRDIQGDWKRAARQGGFSDSLLRQLSSLADSRYGDSLFNVNIVESAVRGVSGSPTLYINGREYVENLSAYPVERHFCQDAPKTGACRNFPACGFDADCRKPGMEGVCQNPMKTEARCVFKPATRFKVTVLNDTACRTCHTGNILAETLKRFSGAVFDYVDIHSAQGQALIGTYGLKTYPAFLFDTAAAKSELFKPIRRTFRKVKDRFILEDYVIKSYRYIGRKTEPGRLDIFGTFENPPFIEMIRDFHDVLADSLGRAIIAFHPVAFKKEKPPKGGNWADAYESPYGSAEVISGANALCAWSRFPKKDVLKYLLCRGDDIQARFEEHTPEPADEWRKCAWDILKDTVNISRCMADGTGRRLFEAGLATTDSLGLNDPGPFFLLNNDFRISGYNPFIKRVLIREIRKASGK